MKMLGRITPKAKKPDESVQNIKSKVVSVKDIDRLYAITRKLSERLTQIENSVGNNRRDIYRIEKRQQRADSELPPGNGKNTQDETRIPGLFGIDTW